MKRTFLFLVYPVIACVMYGCAQMKNKEQNGEIDKLINSNSFVFHANNANPQRGGGFPLTSAYELEVIKDSLNAFLPYFGRAFTAPTKPSEGGLKSSTTDFEKEQKKSKRGWVITFYPKNQASATQMILDISDNGYGNLSVISNNREPISFYGNITALEEKD